jgi:hypothetical protein
MPLPMTQKTTFSPFLSPSSLREFFEPPSFNQPLSILLFRLLVRVMSQRVVVAGAGIGGATAALALARRHISGALYDSAAQFTPKGAGLVLTPNAMKVNFRFLTSLFSA